MEAVFGAEQYKFRESMAEQGAWFNTVLPFTRNVVGPMDYTPVTFSDAKYAHKTTNAHELALSVVFESGVQHFADSAESYRSLPEAAKIFLKQVPSAWDDTRALSGEPGRSIVIARRDRDVWYVGGINGRTEAQTVRVDLGFLKEGSWTAAIVRDGARDREFASETKTVAATDSTSVTMRPRGRFVMRFERRPRAEASLNTLVDAIIRSMAATVIVADACHGRISRGGRGARRGLFVMKCSASSARSA